MSKSASVVHSMVFGLIVPIGLASLCFLILPALGEVLVNIFAPGMQFATSAVTKEISLYTLFCIYMFYLVIPGTQIWYKSKYHYYGLLMNGTVATAILLVVTLWMFATILPFTLILAVLVLCTFVLDYVAIES